MRLAARNFIQKLGQMLVSPGLEPAEQAKRIQVIERDVVLPVKVLIVVLLVYYFYFSNWVDEPQHMREVAFQMIRSAFLAYIVIAAMAGYAFIRRQMALHSIQWTIYTTGLLDGLLFASLTFVTGGFDSFVFWMFPVLILRNAISVPSATPQITLNLVTTLFYVFAGIFDVAATQDELNFISRSTREDLGVIAPENAAEPFLLRVSILVLWTFCCYGVQALLEKHRRAVEEAVEFATRQEQLHTAGRLAAQIAHRIKNPLSIINNSAFSLERAIQQGKHSQVEQLHIIREEVEKADRILTELMGYAQLAEGKVEKLNVIEEIERALQEGFPKAADYKVEIKRSYDRGLHHLMMQRGHFFEILLNLFTNAREAMQGKGTLQVSARQGEDYSVIIEVKDSGPGIAADKIERIFEAYFSTKEKGTGLGLAIARHNAEIYGGTLWAQSELGQGARFILRLPVKSAMKFSK
ncbi:MAG: two-component system sensor histidine kinase NtrB [Limisphaerales bacterium]